MKHLHYFPTYTEYHDYVHQQIFTDDRLKSYPLYAQLIEFVLCEKAPVFFEISHESEYRNFANYVNFQVVRDYYDDKTLQNMFYIHEFMHMAQYLPRGTHATQAEFVLSFVLSEYIASNETEILLHFRLPELRHSLFGSEKILYDILKKHFTSKPTVGALHDLRKAIVETDVVDTTLFGDGSADQAILHWFKTFGGSASWAANFFKQTQGKAITQLPTTNINAKTYESQLTMYRPNDSQAKYESLTLINVRNMFALLGETGAPRIFAECEQAMKTLEGKILAIPNIAKEVTK